MLICVVGNISGIGAGCAHPAEFFYNGVDLAQPVNLNTHLRKANTDSSDYTNPIIYICPSQGWAHLALRDLWAYRELLYFLVWRDLQVRYKQTAFGIAWVILQPVLTMFVFSIFFGHLAGMPSDGIPYPIFTFTALLPWQLFSQALIRSSDSLVANERLITKVYFPRLIIPISAVLGGLVDFGIGFIVLIALMLFFGIVPTVALVALPFFVLLAIATALAIGLWLSALNAQYRDVRYVVPFLVQLWLFATPIAYPSSLIPEPWRMLYGINPMTGVVEGFRWALLGSTWSNAPLLLISTVVVVVLMVSGLVYFKRMERTFVDVI
jgi:lipopolysaccharide transport system permease protein